MEFSPIISATFAVYLVAMFLIGLWAYRQTSNLSDYVLGGRRLGPWPTALSACASDMSGWLLLGLPGYALASGMEASWIAIGLLIGTALNWLLVAQPLRVASYKANDAVTLPAYFANTFGDKANLLRVVSASFILLFFLFYTSSGLVAGGKLFNTVFGLPYEYAVLVGAAAVMLYTLFGGFLAVSWTDVVQGLLMAAALFAVPVVLMFELGDVSAAFAPLVEQKPAFWDPFTSIDGSALSVISIVSLMAWGLGYFGQPHILARFKAISDEKHIPAARRIAVSWTALTLFFALLIGWFGAAYYHQQPLADGEQVFMALVNTLFHPVVAGILLAAVLAAVMSTADSQLLVCSSAFTEDLYRTLFRREAKDQELVWVGRAAVLAVAVVATTLAMDKDSSVLTLVGYAWAGFGAAFGPAVLLSLYWPRMNYAGAVAGIIVGGSTVVLWSLLRDNAASFGLDAKGILSLYEIVPGFILSLVAIVVASLATAQSRVAVANTNG